MKLYKLTSSRWNFKGVDDQQGFKVHGKFRGVMLAILRRSFRDDGKWVNKESFRHYLSRINAGKDDKLKSVIANSARTKAAFFALKKYRKEEQGFSNIKPLGKTPPPTKRIDLDNADTPSKAPNPNRKTNQNPVGEVRKVDRYWLFETEGSSRLWLSEPLGRKHLIQLEKGCNSTREVICAIAFFLQIPPNNVCITIGQKHFNRIESLAETLPSWEANGCLINQSLLDKKSIEALDKIIEKSFSEYRSYQFFHELIFPITNRISRGELGQSDPMLLGSYLQAAQGIIDEINKSKMTDQEKKDIAAVMQLTIDLIAFARQKYDQGLRMLINEASKEFVNLMEEKFPDLTKHQKFPELLKPCKPRENKPTITIKFGDIVREFDKENFVKHIIPIEGYIDFNSNENEFDFTELNFITPDIFIEIGCYLFKGTSRVINRATLEDCHLVRLSEQLILGLYDAAKSLGMVRLELEVGKEIMERLADKRWENRQLLENRANYSDNLTKAIKLFLERTP